MIAASADSAVRAGQASNQEVRATWLAQSRLDEVRGWCQSYPPDHFAQFLTYGQLGTWRAEAHGLESRVELARHATYSPSLASEAFLPADQRSPFDSSLLRARVQVRWGSRPRQQVELNSLIATSRRSWRASDPIEVTRLSGSVPLGQGLSAEFRAVGYDDQGQPIPDLAFSWQVIPGTSAALIEQESADGTRAVLTHHLPKVPGPGFEFAPPGEVWVQATGRLFGVEAVGRLLVQLQ